MGQIPDARRRASFPQRLPQSRLCRARHREDVLAARPRDQRAASRPDGLQGPGRHGYQDPVFAGQWDGGERCGECGAELGGVGREQGTS